MQTSCIVVILLLQISAMKAHHPHIFKQLTSSLDKMKRLLDTEIAAVSKSHGGLGSLNSSNEYDLSFMAELQAIYEIVDAVSTSYNCI